MAFALSNDGTVAMESRRKLTSHLIPSATTPADGVEVAVGPPAANYVSPPCGWDQVRMGSGLGGIRPAWDQGGSR